MITRAEIVQWIAEGDNTIHKIATRMVKDQEGPAPYGSISKRSGIPTFKPIGPEDLAVLEKVVEAINKK